MGSRRGSVLRRALLTEASLGRLYHADAGTIITLTMIMRAWVVNRRWIQINLTASPLVWHGRVWKISGRGNLRSKPPQLLPIGKQERLVYTKGTLFYSMVGCKTLMRTDMNLSSWFSWGQGGAGSGGVFLFFPLVLFLDVVQMAAGLHWMAEELMMCLRINCSIYPKCEHCMLRYRTWPLQKYDMCYSCLLKWIRVLFQKAISYLCW